MPVNSNKPERWKSDISRSVDFYNDWFISYAPKTYRNVRIKATEQVETSLKLTDNLMNISSNMLRSAPSVLKILRMATAPPLARDRLINLSKTKKNLVERMEIDNQIPPRMSSALVDEQLRRKPKNIKTISNNELRKINKWTGLFSRDNYIISDNKQVKLGDFFTIKRGLATGANNFFILNNEQIDKYNIPAEFLVPILPNPRKLQTDEVNVDSTGHPDLIPKQFLLTCDLPEYVVKNNYPSLWKYLQIGIEKGINKRYLCSHRSPWYSQEKRPPAPYLCTYMGRKNKKNNKTFRFILNNSKSTATNVYLMLYPKPELNKLLKKDPDMIKRVWYALNEIVPETLVREGRVYGGELYKLEPKELASTPADVISSILNKKAFQTRIDNYPK